MADDNSPAGLTEIDGKAVSSVSYKREVNDKKVSYQLIFRQGNKQVARLNDLSADQVVAALGEENGKAVHWSTESKGLLKGKTLHYAQGVSPALVESVSDASAADRVADAISKTYAPAPTAEDAGTADVPDIDQRDDSQNERSREIRARQEGNDIRYDDGEVERTPQPSKGSESAQPTNLPRHVVGRPDSWINQNAQVSRDMADRRGLTAEIENRFADGATAKQVQVALGDKLAFLPIEERNGFVVQVRATLGIPSQVSEDGKAEFEAWKRTRQQHLEEPQPMPALEAKENIASLQEMGSGMAQAISDNFYQGWFNLLERKEGSSSAFRNERRYRETRAAYDAGEIKSAVELRAFLGRKEVLGENPPQASELTAKNEIDEDRMIDHAAESEDTEAALARAAARQAAQAEVENRFYRVENKYYHRDNKNRVAFIEGESRLRTAESDAYVAKSMVKISEAKGWDSIKVTGTDEFRRAVWMEAALRGLQVRGYKPKDVDLAELAEKQEARLRNSIEQGDGPENGKMETGQNGKQSEKPNQQTELPKEEPGLVGTVLNHGAAKFDFKPDEKLSYYVRMQTAAGEKIVWGVDLSRALEEGKVKDGDKIRLENLGRQAVQVTANMRDENGKVVGQETITSHRNKWQATHVPDREKLQATSTENTAERTSPKANTPKVAEAVATPPAPEEGHQKPKVEPQQTNAAVDAFKKNIDPKVWTATAEQHPQLKNAYAHLAMFKKFADERLPESLRDAFLQRQVQNIARDVEAGRLIGVVKIATSPASAKAQLQEHSQER